MSPDPTLTPSFVAPGAGRELAWFDARFQVKTAGSTLSLCALQVPQGSEPPLHVHSREDEWFYVVSGEVSFHVGQEVHRGGPGSFMTLPVGIAHTFSVETPTAEMLMLASPGGFETLFEARPGTIEEAVAALASQGIEVVGPHPRGA